MKGDLPMAKKLGKLALFGALAGAAAAGTYYYLQKKNTVPSDDLDDFDDFDDFDEDLDDDFFDESANNTSAANSKPHAHIPIDLDNAKEIIGGKVIETLDKAKEIISDRISPSAPAEAEYTEMDLNTPTSAAYSDAGNTEDADNNPATENFFDDSETE